MSGRTPLGRLRELVERVVSGAWSLIAFDTVFTEDGARISLVVRFNVRRANIPLDEPPPIEPSSEPSLPDGGRDLIFD